MSSGEAAIQGDYFRFDEQESFASGFRLLNIHPASPGHDLCSRFSVRYLNGGPFDGGTVLTIWLDVDEAPSGPILDAVAWDEAGDVPLFANFLPANHAALEATVQDIFPTLTVPFGSIDLQFTDGNRGHVSARLSALGRFSVGYEGVCLD